MDGDREKGVGDGDGRKGAGRGKRIEFFFWSTGWEKMGVFFFLSKKKKLKKLKKSCGIIEILNLVQTWKKWGVSHKTPAENKILLKTTPVCSLDRIPVRY